MSIQDIQQKPTIALTEEHLRGLEAMYATERVRPDPHRLATAARELRIALDEIKRHEASYAEIPPLPAVTLARIESVAELLEQMAR